MQVSVKLLDSNKFLTNDYFGIILLHSLFELFYLYVIQNNTKQPAKSACGSPASKIAIAIGICGQGGHVNMAV